MLRRVQSRALQQSARRTTQSVSTTTTDGLTAHGSTSRTLEDREAKSSFAGVMLHCAKHGGAQDGTLRSGTLFGMATIAVGCNHVSGLLGQPFFTTAGPDVVGELGPDQVHGLDAEQVCRTPTTDSPRCSAAKSSAPAP